MTTPAYITADKLAALFGAGELDRLAKDGTGIDATIETVNSEVDSYVRAARPVGLAEVPTALEMAAANLARFYLYKTNPPPVVETRWKAAVAYLRDVAAGRVALPALVDDPATSEDESTLSDGVWFTTIPFNAKGWM